MSKSSEYIQKVENKFNSLKNQLKQGITVQFITDRDELQKRLHAAGITYAQIGEIVGLTGSAIGHQFKGRRKMHQATLEAANDLLSSKPLRLYATAQQCIREANDIIRAKKRREK